MRKILSVLITLGAVFQLSAAVPANTPTPEPKPKAASSPAPTPEPAPKPKKASLFHRMLYGTPATTPDPKPLPTPQPRTRRKKNAVPAATPTANPDQEESIPAPKEKASPKPKATPTPESTPEATPKPVVKKGRHAKTENPDATPTPAPKPKSMPNMRGDIPFVPEPTANGESTPKPASLPPLEQDAKEKARLREIKTTALEDAQIKALKEKADTASDSGQRAASKEYYKALYEKMRSIDPMLKERIDRMETIMMKRLDGGGAE